MTHPAYEAGREAFHAGEPEPTNMRTVAAKERRMGWLAAQKAAGPEAKRRADLAHDTAGELSDCARDGTASAYLDKPEEACPFEDNTAQAIIWRQAWRLTMDRLSDLT